MAYNSTTGEITAPVSFRDVQLALGTTVNTEHDLCSHPYINIGSKYKPVKDTMNGKTAKKEDFGNEDFFQRNWGIAIPVVQAAQASQNNTIADIIRQTVENGGYAWNTISSYGQQDENNMGNGWFYAIPAAGVNFARITDFNGYKGKQNLEEDTFRANDSLKVMSKTSGYNPSFIIDMCPFAPGNFASLVGLYYGIAFYIPELNTSSPYVAFWVGSTTVAKTYNYNTVELNMPTTMLNTLLTAVESHHTDCTIYAMCFLTSTGNVDNINNNNKYNELNNVRPIFGNSVDLLRFNYIGSSGIRDTMRLAFSMRQEGSLVAGKQSACDIRIVAVTNYYNTTESVYLTTAYLRYTTEVYSSQGVYDATRSKSSRTQFITGNGQTIDVSNTEMSGGQAVPKTTAVSVLGSINMNGEEAEEGSYVIVHLWYLTYGSNPSNNQYDYREGGTLRIVVRNKNFQPTPYDD